MGDMREVFDAMREMDKERREDNLAKADPTGWEKHTDYHWSRTLDGKRLDYWPSKKKFQYDGRIHTGGIEGFIDKRLKQPARDNKDENE